MEILDKFIVERCATYTRINILEQGPAVYTKINNYLDGKLHGVQRDWHSNGQLYYETNYLNGRRHGLERYWYANGRLHYETNYLNGKKCGLQREWYSDGQQKRVWNYLHGWQI